MPSLEVLEIGKEFARSANFFRVSFVLQGVGLDEE